MKKRRYVVETRSLQQDARFKKKIEGFQGKWGFPWKKWGCLRLRVRNKGFQGKGGGLREKEGFRRVRGGKVGF